MNAVRFRDIFNQTGRLIIQNGIGEKPRMKLRPDGQHPLLHTRCPNYWIVKKMVPCFRGDSLEVNGFIAFLSGLDEPISCKQINEAFFILEDRNVGERHSFPTNLIHNNFDEPLPKLSPVGIYF